MRLVGDAADAGDVANVEISFRTVGNIARNTGSEMIVARFVPGGICPLVRKAGVPEPDEPPNEGT